jgi:hypothetical protein
MAHPSVTAMRVPVAKVEWRPGASSRCFVTLIFVYNANSGRLNALLDIGHKIVSPDTYACDLCALTHGAFSEREAWRAFRESTKLDVRFLHKDEFEREFPATYAYPVVLRHDDGLDVLLSREDLAALKSPEALIEEIGRRADGGEDGG